MKGVNRILSNYTADCFGLASALYELGGLIVIHDASGCNSTYTTHDEPRFGIIDSEVYISALTETDAVLGNDDKVINDIVKAAKNLKPKFIVICGTTIPTVLSIDLKAIAYAIEKETNIPSFGINTTGIDDYILGIKKAFNLVFNEFVVKNNEVKISPIENSINILGLTPLDFYYQGLDKSIKHFFEQENKKIISTFLMGDNLENVKNSINAAENIVVAEAGLDLAEQYKNKFNIPFRIGFPTNNTFVDVTADYFNFDKNTFGSSNADVFIIGEKVASLVMKKLIEKETKYKCILGHRLDEDETFEIAKNKKIIIADGLYKAISSKEQKFINLPHIAFSGRLYENEYKNYIKNNYIIKEIKKYETENI